MALKPPPHAVRLGGPLRQFADFGCSRGLGGAGTSPPAPLDGVVTYKCTPNRPWALPAPQHPPAPAPHTATRGALSPWAPGTRAAVPAPTEPQEWPLMVPRCVGGCCAAPWHMQQPPRSPRPRRWCPRMCQGPWNLAVGGLTVTQAARVSHEDHIRPRSY